MSDSSRLAAIGAAARLPPPPLAVVAPSPGCCETWLQGRRHWLLSESTTWSVTSDAHHLSDIRDLLCPVRVMLPDGGSTLAHQAGSVVLKGWADCRMAELVVHNVLLVTRGCCDSVVSLPQLVTTGYTFYKEAAGLHLMSGSTTVFSFCNWVGTTVATSKKPLTPSLAVPLSGAVCPTGSGAAEPCLGTGTEGWAKLCAQEGQ